MADNNLPPELNLEQILATLASLPKTATPPVPPQQQQQQQQPQVPFPYQTPPETYPQPYPPPTSYLPTPNPQPDPRLTSRLTSRPPTTRPQPKAPPHPPTDPTKITTWKLALRHVTHLAASSPSFIPTIRKLISDQARNIADWEAGRERLLVEQKAKRTTEQEHLALLSLPGMSGGGIQPLRTDEVEEEELRVYDGKVWRASERLVGAQGEMLRELGVPFWGVGEGLLKKEGDEGEEGKVSWGEVMGLRRKMLEYLGEMYGD